MPSELWGTNAFDLSLPSRPIGYLLLLFYLVLLLVLLYVNRRSLRRMSNRQWVIVFALSITSLFLSQLFPLRLNLPNQLSPISATQDPVTTVTLFSAFPFLLAGATLNPAAALIVGLFSGLGRSVAQTHQPFDIFHVAFAAVLAAHWLQQNYFGRVYRWLRNPIISGGLSNAAMFMLIGIASFVATDTEASYLSELDLAVSTANAHIGPLLIEGVVGGLLTLLVLLGVPQLRNSQALAPSPPQRSLVRRLLSNFVLFAVLLVVLLVTVVFTVSIRVSTEQIVNQMAYNANTVSAEIPDFQARIQSLLVEYSRFDALQQGNNTVRGEALRQLYRTNPIYRHVLLVAGSEVLQAYPDDGAIIGLTETEQMAVSTTLASNAPQITSAQSLDSEYIISFIVPIPVDEGQPTMALVGRVPDISLGSLIGGLQGIVGRGEGFIVDRQARIIAHPSRDRLLATWEPPENLPRQIDTDEVSDGVAYEGRDAQSNARELVYYVPGRNHSWTVVTTAPYDVVLNLALRIGAPLALVLLIVTAVFYANLVYLGRDITNPIGELVRATKDVAAGRSIRIKIHEQRQDELGQLSESFANMQLALKQRVDDLSLLLSISGDVSNSMDLYQGMPAILKGALRGTTAVGARAIILNPNNPQPFQFGEGPKAEAMKALDRAVMTKLRHVDDVATISRPNQIQRQLDLDGDVPLPINALIAIPMSSHSYFRGILWLGYSQSHRFTDDEKNLLRTLARQASVLVENAYNFARAEGGRRRLAAVLTSTTDAVIVTDQTNRIHLVNPAFETVFGQKTSALINRAVGDMITIEPLMAALTSSDKRPQKLEIPLADGRTFYTSVSPISNGEGQTMGRVAVLHDVTHFKEIDEMKSDFVSTVSHDLRSPLTFMRGYATMLSMAGELNEQQEKYIEKILSGIDQMATLVNNLLDLGRIEAGVELVFEPINIQNLLEEIGEEYWQHAHVQGIKLKVEEPLQPIPVIQGDKALLRQAVTNLVSNGLKYAPQSGQMVLRAEHRQPGEVVVSVKDNGPGIAEKDQMRLFEKFFRIKRRGTEKIKGSGLGLAIVRSIAERHSGRVWVQSELDQGSTFFIALPLEPKVSQNGQTGDEIVSANPVSQKVIQK